MQQAAVAAALSPPLRLLLMKLELGRRKEGVIRVKQAQKCCACGCAGVVATAAAA